MATDQTLEELLGKFATGDEVNFGKRVIPASQLAARIRYAARATGGTGVLTLRNAKINGDLVLNGIGETGQPLTMQIIDCEFEGGFRARMSRWNMLLMAKSRLAFVDIPKSQINELLIEVCRITGSLEARDLEVDRGISLSGSHFAAGPDGVAIQLKEARVGRSLRAVKIFANGSFSGAGMRIDGELRLSGSTVGVREGDGDIALDLAGASIVGPVDICANKKLPFKSFGPVKLVNASVGTLAVLGAIIDGRGGPSIIGDGLRVTDSILLGASDNQPLRTSGRLRFMLVRIGGQFQITDAIAESQDGQSLNLDNAQIDGDIIMGRPGGGVEFKQAATANNIVCGGKIVLTSISADGSDFDEGSSFSIREARVQGGLLLRECELKGCLNIDHSAFGGLSLHEVNICRSKPLPNLDDFPDRYAHEDDALISGNFVTIGSDVHLDHLNLDGGDLRMLGAVVHGAIQIQQVDILNTRRLSLIFQGANLAGGISITGTPQKPSQFGGDFSFMNAKIGSSITLSAIVIGKVAKRADFSIDSAQVSGDVITHRVTVHGKFGATSAVVTGNVRFEGANLLHPGETALHMSGAVISGQLKFAVADPGTEAPPPTVLDGQALLDGIRAGSVSWSGLHLMDKSEIYATSAIVDRSLEALSLTADGAALIDLGSTKVGCLTDRLGDDNDGWGAGKVKLGLEDFRYERIMWPTGRVGADPSHIRSWRKKWLCRRSDASSTQAARQLARILHEQGLHEGSRLVLMDAFAEEGRQAPTYGLTYLHFLFGLFFGHGFSGGRALATVLGLWFAGTLGVMALQGENLLVTKDEHPAACVSVVDPSLYAADLLLPVIDLNQEGKCEIRSVGKSEKFFSRSTVSFLGKSYDLFSDAAIARYALEIYRILGWIAFSLALATWSGIFKRSGRTV